FFNENDVVQVGAVIATIETDSTEQESAPKSPAPEPVKHDSPTDKIENLPLKENPEVASEGTRFYSPLVKSVAAEEGIPLSELDSIQGSGLEGRVTKQDILDYIKNRNGSSVSRQVSEVPKSVQEKSTQHTD